MEKSKVLKDLRSIAEEVIGNPIGEEYDPFDEVTIDHVCVDSLDRIDLMMRCEKRFKVSIPDYDAHFICSFGELANLVCERNKAKEKTTDKI